MHTVVEPTTRKLRSVSNNINIGLLGLHVTCVFEYVLCHYMPTLIIIYPSDYSNTRVATLESIWIHLVTLLVILYAYSLIGFFGCRFEHDNGPMNFHRIQGFKIGPSLSLYHAYSKISYNCRMHNVFEYSIVMCHVPASCILW